MKEDDKIVSVSNFQNAVDASAGSSTWCLPDVVFTSCEVARPVAGLPEAVAVHLPPALAERSVTVWRSLQVEVTQLLQVCSHNLKETHQLFSRLKVIENPENHHIYVSNDKILNMFVMYIRGKANQFYLLRTGHWVMTTQNTEQDSTTLS